VRRPVSMLLSFSFSRSRLFNRRSNHQASPVLRLWVAFSSTSRSPSEPSAANISGYPATIREGRAEIFADESNSVFYNKVQVSILLVLYMRCRFLFYFIVPSGNRVVYLIFLATRESIFAILRELHNKIDNFEVHIVCVVAQSFKCEIYLVNTV
jgi:hypothetical protein